MVSASILAEGISGEVAMRARFDEESLDILFTYDGLPLETPTARPSLEVVLDDPRAAARTIGLLLFVATNRWPA
jgi:hypothetical protein